MAVFLASKFMCNYFQISPQILPSRARKGHTKSRGCQIGGDFVEFEREMGVKLKNKNRSSIKKYMKEYSIE